MVSIIPSLVTLFHITIAFYLVALVEVLVLGGGRVVVEHVALVLLHVARSAVLL